MSKKNLRGLYVITDPELCKDNLLEQAEQALKGGAKILQYRNKQASIEQQQREATALQQLCQQYGCTFIVNDNVELAKAVNADGVHIGQSDTALQQARDMLGAEKIIGVTCNNQIEWAITAQQHSADYIAFGRFFSSSTKPNAPAAELSILQSAREQLTVPVVAIGGITLDNAPLVIDKGADMIAVIHGIFGQADPRQAASALQSLFN